MTKKKKSRRSRSSQRPTPSRQRPAPARQGPSIGTGDGHVAGSLERSDDANLLQDDEAVEIEPGSIEERERPARTTGPARSAGTKRRADTARPGAPRGLFGGLRLPSPFPRFGETVRAAAGAVATSPLLVGLPLVAVLALWLLLLAVGLDHVPVGFMDILAIPPVSSFFDINLVLGTFRSLGGEGVAILFGLILLRALIWAVLVSLILEALRGERPSSLTLAVAIRAVPTSIAYMVINLAAFFLVQTVSVILGNLGGLLSMFGFVAALYFLTFTPVAAAADAVPFREAVRRSVAASRFPGSRHIGLVFLYFFLTFMPLLYTLQAPGPFTANPTVSQWAIVLAVTLLHVVFLAAFAYRYVAVAEQIPEPKPRPTTARRR
jgi:hypothetical protein